MLLQNLLHDLSADGAYHFNRWHVDIISSLAAGENSRLVSREPLGSIHLSADCPGVLKGQLGLSLHNLLHKRFHDQFGRHD